MISDISAYVSNALLLCPRLPVCFPQCASVEHWSNEVYDICFAQYASVERGRDRYMTYDDFIRRYVGLLSEDDYNVDTLKLLASVVNMTKNG